MKHMINGMEFDIPSRTDGTVSTKDIKKVAGIPDGRALVIKRSDGGNQIINSKQNVRIKPGDHIADMSNHRRGS